MSNKNKHGLCVGGKPAHAIITIVAFNFIIYTEFIVKKTIFTTFFETKKGKFGTKKMEILEQKKNGNFGTKFWKQKWKFWNKKKIAKKELICLRS